MEPSGTVRPVVVVTDDANADERAAILAELDGIAEVRFLHDAGEDAAARLSRARRSCWGGT